MRSVLGLAFCFLVALPLRAENPVPPANLLALQDALQESIASAEPAIASITISRSNDYKRYGAAPSTTDPCNLGDFNTTNEWDLIRRNKSSSERRQALLALDLAHPEHQPESYGSGVVIDESGLVLTMAHVIRGATKIYVRLPGQIGSYADIHAVDNRSDLAVIKLLHPPPRLKAIPLGDGSKLRKGQLTLLLANPFAAGFRDGSPTASLGMIGNIRRRSPGQLGELETILEREKQVLHHFGTLVQVDSRIQLGSSGGALLNLQGELIGITTAVAAITGVETPGGFAVPLNAGMRRIVDALRRGQEVEYGFLGVRPLPDGLNPAWITIELVGPSSPAMEAKILANDRIMAINGQRVRTRDDLFLFIGTELAGATVRLDVVGADGEPRVCTARLGKYYYPGPVLAANRPPARFGLRVDYLSILEQKDGIQPGGPGMKLSGVIIREVVPRSSADLARLQPFKIITRVNGEPVKTPSQYYEAIRKAGRTVKLSVLNSDLAEDQVELNDN